MTHEEVIEAAQPFINERATVQDAQSKGFCVIGQRKLWRAFKENNPDLLSGLTFEEFIEEGAPISMLLDFNNQYADTLVEAALERLTANG